MAFDKIKAMFRRDRDEEDATPAALDLKPDAGKFATVLNPKVLVVVGVAVAVLFVLGTSSGGKKKASAGTPGANGPASTVTTASNGQALAWDVPKLKHKPAAKATAPSATKKPAAPQPAGSNLPPVPTIAGQPNPYLKYPLNHTQPGSVPTAPQKKPYTASPQYQAAEASLAAGGGGMNTAWGAGSGGSGIPKSVIAANTPQVPGAGVPSLKTYMAKINAAGKAVAAAAAGTKQAGGSGSSDYNRAYVTKPASPYELMQGSVIPAVLETGINSDLPGQIIATVERDVYSSVGGSDLLVPAGSKLVGTYASKVIAGQTRVAVAWNRIILPNGTYVNIGNMPGADSAGYSGFHDQVNNHLWRIFKTSLLLSLVNAGMASASTGTGSGYATSNSYTSSAETGMAQTFGQAASQLLQKNINISPTLTIRPGYVFKVVVTGDIVFPGPYAGGQVSQSTAAGQPLPATISNPYGQ